MANNVSILSKYNFLNNIAALIKNACFPLTLSFWGFKASRLAKNFYFGLMIAVKSIDYTKATSFMTENKKDVTLINIWGKCTHNPYYSILSYFYSSLNLRVLVVNAISVLCLFYISAFLYFSNNDTRSFHFIACLL